MHPPFEHGPDHHAGDAVIVTDRAGFIQTLNAEAAELPNVGMRRVALRELSPFFVEGRVEMLAAVTSSHTTSTG